MEPSAASLLLEVWREARQDLTIAEAAGRIVPILAQRFPLDLVLVRRLDRERACLETVAAEVHGHGTVPEQVRSDCTPADLERLLFWGARREVFRGPAHRASVSLPRLLPRGIEGDVLVGPLAARDGFLGVLALAARPPRRFQAEHELLLADLLEPLAVALRNDRRLRELTALREAVEADNRSLLSRLGRHDIS